MTRAVTEDAESWDEFVDQHPEGRFCHLWGYRHALEKAVGYRCLYLNIMLDGRRVGVFPSIIIHRGRGRIVSQPFNEYGGPLIQGLSAEQAGRVPELLLHTAAEEHCDRIEIRGGIGCEALAMSDYCRRYPLHSYATLNLGSKEQLWRKSLTHEARKDVKRAERAGLTTSVRRGSNAVAGPFYGLYLQSMKRLGAPPHSRRFFVILAESLGDRLVAVWASSGDRVAAILLGATTGRRLHIFVTASDRRAWNVRPNDLAHWRLIEWAAASGIETFDFGSARYGGQIQFKKKWGVTLREYSCYSIGSPETPATFEIQTVKSDSRSMMILSRAWSALVPTIVAQLLGPPIRKHLTK